MRDDATIALLFVIAALFGGVVWSVWRHRIVQDMHAIRSMLERRERWDEGIARDLHALVQELRGDDDDGA